MKLVNPSYEIYSNINGKEELYDIELAARICYKSQNKMFKEDFEGTKNFIRGLISRGHEAMLEHSNLCVKFVCDRGVSHEIVRHRHFSFAQESTRYCNYANERFGGEIICIKPFYIKMFDDGTDYQGINEKKNLSKAYENFVSSLEKSEKTYFYLLDHGFTAQQARAVLPTCLKTEIVVTGNYREWRHFFNLRCAKDAHPQMQEIAKPLCKHLNDKIPVIFEDICEKYDLYKSC